VAMLFIVAFFTWIYFRRSVDNDRRIAQGRPLFENENNTTFGGYSEDRYNYGSWNDFDKESYSQNVMFILENVLQYLIKSVSDKKL
jgi:hypothetical protein